MMSGTYRQVGVGLGVTSGFKVTVTEAAKNAFPEGQVSASGGSVRDADATVRVSEFVGAEKLLATKPAETHAFRAPATDISTIVGT